MVDLRARAAPAQLDEEPVDLHQAERLTPPSRDLMDALHTHFAVTIPDRGSPSEVALEVAEMRGAWMVINFLQATIDSQTQERR